MKSFIKIFKSEFKSQFSVGIIVGIIIAAIVPLIAPLASGNVAGTRQNPTDEFITQMTFQSLARMLGEAVVYTLIIRLTMIFRERTTVDRNRTLYLKYDKNSVLFGKTIVDLMIFMSSIIFVMTVGTVLVVEKNGGKLSSDAAANFVVYILAIVFLYAVMSMGIRWAISSIENKMLRGFSVAAIAILTAGLYSILGIVEGVVSKTTTLLDAAGNPILDNAGKPTTIQEFPIIQAIQNNKYVFAFVPFLNIAVIPLAIGGQMEAWTLVPFIFEMLIIIGLIWKSLAKNLKTYLAA